MKKYIELNTRLRTAATNDFEKDFFFKLMNKSVFSKTMKDVEKHIDVRLVNDKTKLNKLVAKSNFDGNVIFSENFVAVHKKKTRVIYNKPIYLGNEHFWTLKDPDVWFHYDYIKPEYGDKAKLLMTDTDSLVYEIETNDFYADTKDDVESKTDTSKYSKDHPTALAPELGDVSFKVGCN
jgi:hypothetical protein